MAAERNRLGSPIDADHSVRRSRTIAALVDAARAEINRVGYTDLTVRNVARAAGVSSATAYTYFGSKDHLVAEVFWQRLIEQPDELCSDDEHERVVQVLSTFGLVVAAETEVAAAVTFALLGDDPAVAELRERIGRELHSRLVDALGDDATPSTVRTLGYLLSGVLLHVGRGHVRREDLPSVFDEVTRVVLGRRPSTTPDPSANCEQAKSYQARSYQANSDQGAANR